MTYEHEVAVNKLNQRIEQMISVIEFRKHWSYRGLCNESKTTFTQAGTLPCPCIKADFSCRVDSYSAREYLAAIS